MWKCKEKGRGPGTEKGERRKGLQGMNQNKEKKTTPAEALLGCVHFAPKPLLCILKVPM